MHAPSLDFCGSPWRRLILSDRRDIWCLVDACDYDWLVENNWNYGWHVNTRWKYYAKRNVGAARSTVYLHREILLRSDPRDLHLVAALDGDHINGQSLDNRRCNLRWATRAKNNANRRPRVKIPSLDRIAGELLRQWRARALEDIPF